MRARGRCLVAWVALALGSVAATLGVVAAEEEPKLPVIVGLTAPPRLRVGTSGEIRLTYRAPQANVVAVVQTVEDLDGADVRRSTRQREVGVIARAFGREAGDLPVPLSFGSPGWKRVTLTLVTDEREESDPATVEIEAIP